MRQRRDPDTGEYREITWVGALLLGLTNEQVKGAIIVGWRLVTAIGLMGAYGLLAPAGFDGFAKASEAKEVRINALDAEIFELRIKQCQAVEAGTNAIVWTERLNEKWRQYRDLTGRDPRVPDCKELK